MDGGQRVKCAMFACQYLTEDGVQILNNSEREHHGAAKDFMENLDFKRLDFYRIGSIVNYEFCSSVFYRHRQMPGDLTPKVALK